MAKSTAQMLEDEAPWKPPPYTNADAAAIQALNNGRANVDQQKRALAWILEGACDIYGFAYRPGSNDRDTNIALGRQLAGQQIRKLIKVQIGTLKEET